MITTPAGTFKCIKTRGLTPSATSTDRTIWWNSIVRDAVVRWRTCPRPRESHRCSFVDDALNALETARGGPVLEGNVGGGTGMICYEFKCGTGTSSRKPTSQQETGLVAEEGALAAEVRSGSDPGTACTSATETANAAAATAEG